MPKKEQKKIYNAELFKASVEDINKELEDGEILMSAEERLNKDIELSINHISTLILNKILVMDGGFTKDANELHQMFNNALGSVGRAMSNKVIADWEAIINNLKQRQEVKDE